MNALPSRFAWLLHLLLEHLPLYCSRVNYGTRLLGALHLLLRNAFVLGAWLPFLNLLLLGLALPSPISLTVLLFVLAVSLLLLHALVALFASLRH